MNEFSVTPENLFEGLTIKFAREYLIKLNITDYACKYLG